MASVILAPGPMRRLTPSISNLAARELEIVLLNSIRAHWLSNPRADVLAGLVVALALIP